MTLTINAQDLKNYLEQVPNLEIKIKALLKSPNFTDLGEALNATIKEQHAPFNYGEGATYCKYCGGKIDPEIIQCPNCQRILEETVAEEEYTEDSNPENFAPSEEKQTKLFQIISTGFALTVWLAVSGWMLTSFPIDWFTITALAIFWLVSIPLFRSTIGGN